MAYFDTLARDVVAWAEKQKTTPWIFLSGDLGAGKTTLTSEVLALLGFPLEEVQSPTFLKVVSYEHSGEIVLHMDAYRVEEPVEFLRMGLEDYDHLKMGIVEWPESFEAFLNLYPAFQESLDVKSVLRIELNSDHSLKSLKGD